MGNGQRAQISDYAVHQRQHHLVTAGTQHQCVGQVIDVLGGAGKVDKFIHGCQLWQGSYLLLQ